MKTDKPADKIQSDSALTKNNPWNYWVFRAHANGSASAEKAGFQSK
jgi:hypothetical protein